MAFSMGDQFKGLPMDQLIAGPLIAACDAQVRLANATAAFIQQVGFLPPQHKSGDPASPDPAFDPDQYRIRTVAFRFQRPARDAAPSADGKVAMETVEMDVPLLAIVKIPALAINTVDITFDMEVKNSESESQKDSTQIDASADASAGWGPFSAKVHIGGSVSSARENMRSSDQSAKYHVQLRAEDKGMPEGLARVLDIMNSAIAPAAIGAPAHPDPKPPMQAREGGGATIETEQGEDQVFRTRIQAPAEGEEEARVLDGIYEIRPARDPQE